MEFVAVDEAMQRRASALADAEKAKMATDKVRAMARAAGQQGWSSGQRLRDLIDQLDGVPVRTRPDAWRIYRWSPPEDETDNRVCHVSVEALAEAMRMFRLERDGSPCWSTVEARELLDEAMLCELEPLVEQHGRVQSTYRKMKRCQVSAKQH